MADSYCYRCDCPRKLCGCIIEKPKESPHDKEERLIEEWRNFKEQQKWKE